MGRLRARRTQTTTELPPSCLFDGVRDRASAPIPTVSELPRSCGLADSRGMLNVRLVKETTVLAMLACAALVFAAGCGGSSRSQPARSPALDYPPPAQETSQGEVVGADRTRPDDKLKTGGRVGPGRVFPSHG